MKYLVRMSCEYSVLVEANTEDEATDKADVIDISDWDTAWSGYEIDETYDD